MKKSNPKRFPAVKHSGKAENSGIFSHGTAKGKQKVDPTSAKFHGNAGLLRSALMGHVKTRKTAG